MMPGKGDMDLLLSRLSVGLRARGVTCAGVVQRNVDCGPERRCDMDLTVLHSGDVLRISQSLGMGARGCRLDPAALEQAVAATSEALGDSDLLLVNKFGKHEAQGRGFRPLIGEAIAADIPVLCGVNGANLPAFQEFTGGLAVEVAPDLDALMAWAEAQVAQTAD
jgi:nucleoside-triphosphatase THEP1